MRDEKDGVIKVILTEKGRDIVKSFEQVLIIKIKAISECATEETHEGKKVNEFLEELCEGNNE